jgi:hypothetical protein
VTRHAPYDAKSKKGAFAKKMARTNYEWKEQPETFTRHKMNRSFCTKQECVFWTVELIFHCKDGKVEKRDVKHKITDTTCIESLIPEDMKSMNAFYKKLESRVFFHVANNF